MSRRPGRFRGTHGRATRSAVGLRVRNYTVLQCCSKEASNGRLSAAGAILAPAAETLATLLDSVGRPLLLSLATLAACSSAPLASAPLK